MSSPIVQAYLNFNGRCEEALAFYQTALGAKLDPVMYFKDAPPSEDGTGCGGEAMPNITPDKVMHTSFHVGETMIMASDCECDGKTNFAGFTLSLGVGSKEEATRYFAALQDGGKVVMPLGPTFWSPCFGMVTDRFGVSWMVNVLTAQECAN